MYFDEDRDLIVVVLLLLLQVVKPYTFALKCALKSEERKNTKFNLLVIIIIIIGTLFEDIV